MSRSLRARLVGALRTPQYELLIQFHLPVRILEYKIASPWRVREPIRVDRNSHPHTWPDRVFAPYSGFGTERGCDQEFVIEAGDAVAIPALVEYSYVALEDTPTPEEQGLG